MSQNHDTKLPPIDYLKPKVLFMFAGDIYARAHDDTDWSHKEAPNGGALAFSLTTGYFCSFSRGSRPHSILGEMPDISELLKG